MGTWLHLKDTRQSAYLAVPESGSGPGVLVLHAWWGLTGVFTDVCDQLADAGFVALAPSLYANNATTDSIEEAEHLANAHDSEPGTAIGILHAAIDSLTAHPAVSQPGIAVMGYSLGAYWALHLSQVRPQEVVAVVSVYGTSDGDFSTARAAYLGHFAEHDAFEPLDAVRALESTIRDAGRDVTFHVYPGTGHWFVEPNRPDVYNPEAAARAWSRTLAFLHAQLDQPTST